MKIPDVIGSLDIPFGTLMDVPATMHGGAKITDYVDQAVSNIRENSLSQKFADSSLNIDVDAAITKMLDRNYKIYFFLLSFMIKILWGAESSWLLTI